MTTPDYRAALAKLIGVVEAHCNPTEYELPDVVDALSNARALLAAARRCGCLCLFTQTSPENPVTRAWIAAPDGWSEYIGYVFAADKGKAKALACSTDPGSGKYVDLRIRRRPDLDGMAAEGVAFWSEGELPANFPVAPENLWSAL